MNETASILCPICNHAPLTLGRVCRVCMGLDDEYGNPIRGPISKPSDIVFAGILFEAEDNPAPVKKTHKKTHKKKKQRSSSAVSCTGHIKTAICPICRKRLAPWQKNTCGDPVCIVKEQRIQASMRPKKACTRCGYPWPATSEHFYGNTNRPGWLDAVCKRCRIEEAKQRQKQHVRGVRGRNGKNRAGPTEK